MSKKSQINEYSDIIIGLFLECCQMPSNIMQGLDASLLFFNGSVLSYAHTHVHTHAQPCPPMKYNIPPMPTQNPWA